MAGAEKGQTNQDTPEARRKRAREIRERFKPTASEPPQGAPKSPREIAAEAAKAAADAAVTEKTDQGSTDG